MPSPVEHSLGADLVWWRTSGGMRTAACLHWGGDHEFDQSVHLVACLHDANGAELVRWRIALSRDQSLVFDSAAEGEWRAFAGIDGILALHLCTDDPPGADALKHERLYPSIDWLSPDGHLSTLHSDQIESRHVTRPQGITEVVVVETGTEHNTLVVLNGSQPQRAGALTLTVTNHQGHSLTASHEPSMAPYTVASLELARMFPGLAAFGEERPLLVTGKFDSRGLYTRPYLVTTGSRQGAYHGGDLYLWPQVHPAKHAMIQAEVNPMAVMRDGETRTWINILHCHDGHDHDAPVDIRLFNDEGRCVLDLPQGCVAVRHKLTRLDLDTLLPQGTETFSGHVSLSYSVIPDQYVPAHVQALLEYQHRDSVARVMGWSDEWNSRPMLARRKRLPRHLNSSYYRVWHDGGLETEIAITNAGHRDYSETARATLTLLAGNGAASTIEVDIAPYATLRGTVSGLFGKEADILATAGIGILRLDSTSDLAAISITRNQLGTALAIEHFLSLLTRSQGVLRMPAGS